MRALKYLILLFMPGIALANVVENLENQTYQVRGNGSASLQELINNATPIRHSGRIFHGYTKWTVAWNYQWKSDSNGVCRITQAVTKFNVSILLPTLIDSNTIQRVQFDNYSSNLRIHEMGHYSIGRRAAEAVDAMIQSMPPMSNCAVLKDEIKNRAHQLVNQYRQLDSQYDVDTNHGIKQGARL